MLQIINPADCCGCTACESICPHDAINMHPDSLGFLYPDIDTMRCIDCGLCEKVCNFNGNYETPDNYDRPIAVGARHKNPEEVATSRSGAVFIALSDYILEHGGIVYGVGYTGHFRVVHKRATTKVERNEFKGSKYVQSDLTGIFRQVRKDLTNGLTVLFSGTPCQTAGLNSFIGKRLRDKLILVDIVCHGAPGPNLWRDYLSLIERKQGDAISEVNFRDKQEFGWAAHHETFRFVKTEGKMIFTTLFYKHIMFRKSCGKCHYANTRRPSDITLGDFWGWEKTDSNFNKDDKGVSLILINTPKGRELFETVKDRMKVMPAELENCLQANLCHPSAFHPEHDRFVQDYCERGFEYAAKKYGISNSRSLYVKIEEKLIKVLKSIKKGNRL